MQKRVSGLPLNGVRAFEAAARHRSLKSAAIELGVTPSAVSHQVKLLETALGTKLFDRLHNSIVTTADGSRFFDSVSPAFAAIDRAAQGLKRDAHEVVLSVSTSFALRWLIPRLHEFREAYPRIRVKMETARLPIRLEDGIDLAIGYVKAKTHVPDAIHLISDYGRPVASQLLAQKYGGGSGIQNITKAPLISAAYDEWDWREWSTEQNIDFSQLRIVDRFDTDHAALEACTAGMGVYIAPEFMIQAYLANEILVRFGDYPAHLFGGYWLFKSQHSKTSVDTFIAWLVGTVSATAPL